MKISKQGHKVALYIRVSTEEQASNPEGSIKNQEQRLRANVDLRNLETRFGEVVAVFIDRARSGKDTNRPELQRMLQAIRNREITLVMVSELSRLSRSIKDFCDIWELMRSLGCEFQSLREQFDTTTAAGEMVLYTIANIAQFERKQTSERISANFKARAERGLTNGGPVPFGYVLDPDKKGHLVVNEVDAAIVREAFNTFLREGILATTARSLNHRGYRMSRHRQGGGGKPRLGHFTVENTHHLLTNRAYIGVRVFKVDGEEKTSMALWKPIVEESAFEKVQVILKKNRYRLKMPSAIRYPYLLTGLVQCGVCGVCGDRLTGKSAHGNGGKIGYYEHSWATRRQACLNKKIFDHAPQRILAKMIEPKVWERVTALLTDPSNSELLIASALNVYRNENQVQNTDRLRSKVRGIEEQVEALAEHLAKIPKGLSPAPIFSQMEKLEALKSVAAAEVDDILRSGVRSEPPTALRDYQTYLAQIRQLLTISDSPELRTKIIHRLVRKIEVAEGALRIHFYVGKHQFVQPEPVRPTGSDTERIIIGGLPSGKAAFTFLDNGSNRLTNGGSARGRTVDLYHVKVMKAFFLNY